MAGRKKKEPVRLVWDKCVSIDRYDLEGNVAAIITKLQDKLLEIPEEFRSSARIDISTGLGYYDSIEVEVTLEFQRPENDEERAAREAQEREWEEQQEARERAQLKSLLEKYGEKK